jgi:hypothetical protein
MKEQYIRQELNIFDVGEKIKGYEQKYFVHILRIPTY